MRNTKVQELANHFTGPLLVKIVIKSNHFDSAMMAASVVVMVPTDAHCQCVQNMFPSWCGA